MNTVEQGLERQHLMRRKARLGWRSLALAVGLHLLVLGTLPQLDTETRCPVVMLVSLAEVEAASAPVTTVPPQPVTESAPAVAPAQKLPAKTKAQQKVITKPSPSPAAKELPHTSTSPAAETGTSTPAAQVPSVEVQSPTRVESGPAGDSAADSSVRDSGASPAEKLLPSSPAPGTPVAGSSGAELPSAPAAQPAPRVDRDAVVGAYKRELAALVASAKFYPAHDRDAGHTGTVKVRFEIGADGSLKSSSVVQSSGYPGLDAAALEAVTRAASSFPPIPAELNVNKVAATIPLRYGLR